MKNLFHRTVLVLGLLIVSVIVLAQVYIHRHSNPYRDFNERPVEMSSEAVEEVRLSVITLPMAFSAAALEEIINIELPEYLKIPQDRHSRRVAGVRVSVNSQGEVTRGPIQIEARDGGLLAHTELRARLHVWRGNLQAIINGIAEVTVHAVVDVDGDAWTLEPDVLISYRWLNRPHTRIAGVTVSLGTRVDRILQRNIPQQQERIAEQLREAVDLQAVMTEMWQKLHEPVQLSESPPLWLVIEPTALGLPSPTTAHGRYQLTPWIKSRLSIVSEPVSVASRDDWVLPALDKRPPEGNHLSIIVPLKAPYPLLSDQLETAISRRPIDFDLPGMGNASIHIDDVVVYPSAPRLTVGLRITSSSPTPVLDGMKGWLWVSGTPKYRESEQRLVVTDITVDSDIEMDSQMHVIYNGFIRLWLQTYLSKVMVWDLAPYITQLHERVDPYLNTTLGTVLGDDGHRLLNTRLISEGAIQSVRIGRITPAADHLVVPVVLDGEVRLVLQPEH